MYSKFTRKPIYYHPGLNVSCRWCSLLYVKLYTLTPVLGFYAFYSSVLTGRRCVIVSRYFPIMLLLDPLSTSLSYTLNSFYFYSYSSLLEKSDFRKRATFLSTTSDTDWLLKGSESKDFKALYLPGSKTLSYTKFITQMLKNINWAEITWDCLIKLKLFSVQLIFFYI